MEPSTVIELAPKSLGSVLCLGAHADDIEIGCGGTILRLTQQNPSLQFHWVVFSAGGDRHAEAASSAEAFLRSCQKRQIDLHSFQDGFFPSNFSNIKQTFEHLKTAVAPDVILTHYASDRHQDHRVVSELTWNTFRSHLILEYEIPKYDGDLGQPNVFVALDEALCDQKIDLLYEHFPTQAGKTWFDRDTFRGLMRLRGVESAAPGRFAEAFYGRKLRFF
ncbi:MAG: PIG-L deacetylase family protein [Polyangiales bacterium]